MAATVFDRIPSKPLPCSDPPPRSCHGHWASARSDHEPATERNPKQDWDNRRRCLTPKQNPVDYRCMNRTPCGAQASVCCFSRHIIPLAQMLHPIWRGLSNRHAWTLNAAGLPARYLGQARCRETRHLTAQHLNPARAVDSMAANFSLPANAFDWGF